jgi:hypothetical protein
MIKLIDKNERLTFEIEGAKFYYRRIGALAEADITRECTSERGELNFGEVARRIVGECTEGWEGVFEGEQEAPFSREKLTEILADDRLPSGIVYALYRKITQANPEANRILQGELKN